MKRIRILSLALFLIVGFSIHCTAFATGTPTTVTALMEVLNSEKTKSVYNIKLNAPFSKETSGVRENISSETGELTLTSDLFDIPGRNGMDLSLELEYRSRDAKVYEERTMSANTSNSYGQTIIAYYDVVDANGFWLRTAALQYTILDPTILATVTMGTETWTFTGYLQTVSGTAVLSTAGIQNYAGAKSNISESKYVFGQGWSLNLPSLILDGDSIYVTLKNGYTYKTNAGQGTGLVDYKLADATFKNDTTVTQNGNTSAYRLYYTTGEAYYYTADGYLIRKQDRFGNALLYQWTALNGRMLLTQITDSGGRSITLSYTDTSITATCGARTVQLLKQLVPGQTSQYYLKTFVDADGNPYEYSYQFDSAQFDLIGKTAAVNTYADIVRIAYPTGASSNYTYQKSTKNLGLSGSMEYFKILSRYDDVDGRNIEKYTYQYTNEPDGYPTYKADTLPATYQYTTGYQAENGLHFLYTYNKDHQMIKKSTEAARKLNEETVSYDTTLNVPVQIKDTTYNEAGASQWKQSVYTYDNRGNRLTENDTDDTMDANSTAYLKKYAYSPAFELMTSAEYQQDAATKIREEYTLSADGKAVSEEKVFSNEALIKNVKYKTDTFGNVVSQSVRLAEGVFKTTEYEYGSAYQSIYPTKVIYKNVWDAGGGKSDLVLENSYDFMTGLLLSTIDGNGNTTKYSYDALGRVLKTTAPDDTASSCSFDDSRNVITTTDQKGNSLIYEFDKLGNLKTVRAEAPDETLAKMTYDTFNRPVLEIDANGNTREITYDVFGRISSQKDADAHGTLLADTAVLYDEAAKDSEGNEGYKIRILQKAEQKDIATDYYFDSRESLFSLAKYHEGSVLRSEYKYDYLGNKTAYTDFTGKTAKAEYDAFGDALKVTDPSGVTTEYEYDGAGNCIRTTDALGNKVTQEYNELGQLIAKSLPGENDETSVTEYYYDGVGNLTKTIDPEGSVTNNVYSSTGKLTAVEQVLGPNSSNITQMKYDDTGNMTELIRGISSDTDTDGSRTSYTYDRFGRQLTETDPAGKMTYYRYDGNGNLTSKTDRNEVTTAYSYDGLNRLTNVLNSKDGEAGQITNTYDLLGNKTLMKDASGAQTYLYDDLSRLSLINYGNGIEEKYDYDAEDRITKFLLTQGTAPEIDLNYEYDPAGRVTAVSDQGVRTLSTYDEAGRLTKEQNGYTGISARYSYTPAGNLTSLRYFNGEELLDSYEYSYDKRGNQTEKVENGVSTSYRYDPLSRIKTVSEEGGLVLNYEYDNLGNISSVGEIGPGGIAETTYQYDPCGRLILAKTDEAVQEKDQFFSYDAEGNQILRGTTVSQNATPIASWEQELTYNGDNRLSYVIEQNAKTTENTSIIAYQYNGDGLRTSREVNGDMTRYTYDRGNIVLETNADYLITAKNVRDSRQLMYRTTNPSIATDEIPGTTTGNPTTGAAIATGAVSGNTVFYQFNGHGDVTKLRNLNGEVIKDYSYNPYGKEKETAMEAFGGSMTTVLWKQEESTIDNPFRYCGEYLDDATGLYYLRARDYDPETQTFITEDPMKDGGNWYVYCFNNPVNSIDPSGYTTQADKDKLAKGTITQDQYKVIIQLTYIYNSIDKSTLLNDDAKKIAKDGIHEQAEIYRNNGYNYKTPNGSGNTGRSPDFWNLTINVGSVVGGTFSMTWDYVGRTYGGVGGNLGKSLSGVSVSFTANWVRQDKRPRNSDLKKYCTGLSVNVSMGAGIGYSVSYSSSMPNPIDGYGLFSPQVGFSGVRSWQLVEFGNANLEGNNPIINPQRPRTYMH